MMKIHNTELRVSEVSLGTAAFGDARTREESYALMDVYRDQGGNFLDTALVYGDWGPEPASSEKIVGEWLKMRGLRNEIVISTKGCHPLAQSMEVPRVGAEYIAADVEKSLQHLQTDWIDLYFLHRDDPKVPIAEIMEALEEQVHKGNIRYYGFSNWQLDRIKEAASYAKNHGYRGFTCNQCMYALTDVNPEARHDLVLLDAATYDYQKETQLSFMAYMCLAGGYFGKKMQGRPVSEGQRVYYDYGANEALLAQLQALEKEGLSANDMMLQYVKQMAFPSVAIVGCSKTEQLVECMEGMRKEVPYEILESLLKLKVQQYNWRI